jgi:hypothetical protein
MMPADRKEHGNLAQPPQLDTGGMTMHRIMTSILFVLQFISTAANLYAQGVSFQPAVDYFADPGPSSVAVADFNGDRVPDLAMSNSRAGSVSVLLANGDGTFRDLARYAEFGADSTYSVAAGDFYGRGILDLLVAGYGESTGDG